MTTAWNWYVILLVLFNLLGITWLLWWTAKRRPGDPKPEDTSHYWDGDITEFNKPMPRWWINGFYIAIAFSFGYLFWYGGFGTYPGISHWSSKGEHDTAAAEASARLERTFAPYKGQAIDALAQNPTAIELGRSIFANNCATCHGSSAKGAIGYPNLTDDIWHWGGSPDQVLTTVLKGREGVMPAWGKALAGMGGPDAVDYVIAYVRQLGNKGVAAPNDFAAARGKELFESVCAACHGKDGKGNPALGAPDLTDGYWLYGDSTESLRETIANGRHGSMPAWGETLGDTRTRLVAAYVWSLSHRAGAGTPRAAQ
ncbi:cytochrome-c oxidase, cbb3-type subunit III [Thermomonas sp.]|uniref:cytochrome-c oxidase, cbb3-type subunit III n=1 Tax=Thermomonas sp. TaxID=1971895 RepID=UPI002C32D20F|nr:cytochrome-c oxidase, cbb3-type subunit III [Thermomonas sp.]HRO63295.1 cytochrome-c oxidase, cbb3-type subunit III [Thermomonas sp.]